MTNKIKNKILLVDGSNLLFQMFFGMPARIFNKDGKAVHGTLGFVGALLQIMRMVQPTHVAVLFDGECANERCEILSEYKANRPDYSQVEENLNPYSQIADIYVALDYMGVAHAETSCCETDDWIASYAHRYANEQIVVSSFDSDYFQLISDNLSVLRYRGKNTVVVTAEQVKQKFGVFPWQYADFKALVGDTSDNIKGAPKIGVKTAASLLRQFGTLHNVIVNAESISKPSVRKSVENYAERLKTNYLLIKLTGEVELPFQLEELKYVVNEELVTSKILRDIGLM